MAKGTTINIDVEATVEDRGEYWAAKTHPFAITVYAASPEELPSRARKAVEHLFAALSKHGDLYSYLNRKGVKYTVIPERPDDRTKRFEFEAELVA